MSVLACLVLPPCLAHAQAGAPEAGLIVVGHAGGQRRAIAADGKFLIRGAGTVVELYAADDQASLLGTVLLDSLIQDVALDGRYAYAATEAGLDVIDLANPAQLRRIASVRLGSTAAVALAGSLAYVAQASGEVAVVDVSDPLSPVVVRSAPEVALQGSRPVAMRLSGTHLTVLDAEHVVRQYSLARPQASDERAHDSLDPVLDPDAPVLFAVEGDRVLVRDGDRTRLLDFGDLGLPGNDDLVAPPREIARVGALRGNRVVLAGSEEFWVMDVAGRGQATMLGHMEIERPATSLALSADGMRAFVGLLDGSFAIIKLDDPGHLEAVGVMQDIAEVDELALNSAVKDRPAMVALHARPRVVHQLAPDGTGLHIASAEVAGRELHGMAMLGGRLYASANAGLLSFEPNSPWQARRYDVGVTRSVPFTFAGYVAALAPGGYWLVNPADTKVVSPWVALPGDGEALAAAVHGDRLYVASETPGRSALGSLRVLSVARPDAPSLTATLDLPGRAETLAVGKHILVGVRGRSANGLIVVGAGSEPGIQGFVVVAPRLHGLASKGDCAYAFGGEGELLAFDVSDPEQPRLAATLRLPGTTVAAASVLPFGGLLYVPRGSAGIYVVRDAACAAEAPR